MIEHGKGNDAKIDQPASKNKEMRSGNASQLHLDQSNSRDQAGATNSKIQVWDGPTDRRAKK